MLENIDALVALESFGTVSEAATRLRLTQSAVSKRIQALQATLGFRLVEPDGRRLRLTAPAVEFLARARPLVGELRDLLRPAVPEGPWRVSLALADSIASSWGPAAVRDAVARLAAGGTAVDVELHAHRSVLVLESVRLGRYDVGLCTEPAPVRDLMSEPICREPMVFVHAGLARRADPRRPLITIEPGSATWRAVEPLLRARQPALLGGPLVPVESFGAVLQMVRAGFGNGLVPLGLAREARLDRRSHDVIAGVTRPVALFTRKTVGQLAAFVALTRELVRAAAVRLAPR